MDRVEAMVTAELEPMCPDSEAVYDAEISPLVAQIIAICKKHKIPMLAAFQYADASHESGAGFCTTRIPFGGEDPRVGDALRVVMARPLFTAFTITTKPTE